MGNSRGDIYRRFIKRPLDLILSLTAILLLSPIIFLIAFLVRVKLGSPIIFKQERPGFNEEIFTMYKFRTMSDKRDENGDSLPDSERLTKFGIFLRSTSLDELPELFNIVKGEMAIIGPRPLLVKYLQYYTEHERRRHTVRPGLSGLSQINGRNNLDWNTRLSIDVEYVNKMSFLLDTKIIIKTIIKAFKREDVTVVDVSSLRDLNIERKVIDDNKRIIK